jgi:hypothetical protein
LICALGSDLPDWNLLLSLGSFSSFGNNHPKHPFVEVSFDLILIDAIGQLERTLKAAIAALYQMIGILMVNGR